MAKDACVNQMGSKWFDCMESKLRKCSAVIPGRGRDVSIASCKRFVRRGEEGITAVVLSCLRQRIRLGGG